LGCQPRKFEHDQPLAQFATRFQKRSNSADVGFFRHRESGQIDRKAGRFGLPDFSAGRFCPIFLPVLPDTSALVGLCLIIDVMTFSAVSTRIDASA